MATIKFDKQHQLDELISRIYLDTKKKYTKKDLLELIFEIGIQDYHALLEKVKNENKTDSKDLRNQFINTFSGSITVPNPDEVNPKSIWEKDIED